MPACSVNTSCTTTTTTKPPPPEPLVFTDIFAVLLNCAGIIIHDRAFHSLCRYPACLPLSLVHSRHHLKVQSNPVPSSPVKSSPVQMQIQPGPLWVVSKREIHTGYQPARPHNPLPVRFSKGFFFFRIQKLNVPQQSAPSAAPPAPRQ